MLEANDINSDYRKIRSWHLCTFH